MSKQRRENISAGGRWIPVALVLTAWLMCATFSRAQSAGTGALSGAVTDPQGGSVAGAKIVVTSQATRESRTVVSDGRGVFLVSALSPELYTVEVSKDGFKALTARDVRINVTETTALDLHLEIGQISERVVVEGHTQQLQTESSALGRVTSGEQVRDL
jgi:trimeric autotransporter adhesin